MVKALTAGSAERIGEITRGLFAQFATPYFSLTVWREKTGKKVNVNRKLRGKLTSTFLSMRLTPSKKES